MYADRLRENEWAIFLFHGVTEEAHSFGIRNYTRKHIPTSDFAAIMRSLLAAGGVPAPMDWASSYHLFTPGVAMPFTITFDDGFANVLNAVPILKELQIPATFYIATDWVDRNQMAWIDRIEWAMECSRASDPNMLTMAAKNLDEIRSSAKGKRWRDLAKFATESQKILGVPNKTSGDGPLDQKLTWDQIKELAADPLFTIGGHTHTHATLPFLTEEESRREIGTCLDMLREKAGVATEHFSYPEGQEWSYSERTIEQLKDAGIRVCPTAMDGTNPPGTDPFRLKRIMVT